MMAVDTPARIAVLGAGPIGLETALYARFLGYDVDIYEQGIVGENIRAWGHVRMFSPFEMNRSPLAMAAMQAQSKREDFPADDAFLTGQEFVDQWMVPLSKTDLLSDCLREKTKVLAIGREEHLKGDAIGSDSRGDFDFILLVRGADGQEGLARADIVIDTTGTYPNHHWAGQSGIPAPGEIASQAHIAYHLPDVLNAERELYAGKEILVIGSGYSAATTIVALAELKVQQPNTKITWVTRSSRTSPVLQIENDSLPLRAKLTSKANELAGTLAVPHYPGTYLETLRYKADKDKLRVALGGEHEGTLEVDRIIANVGYRPDTSLYEELQMHQCYATQGPMKLATAMLKETSPDCLDQSSHGPDTLINPEPHFYVLGSKSYGRNSNFLISVGLQQIRELFTIIGDRADLDLYSTVGSMK